MKEELVNQIMEDVMNYVRLSENAPVPEKAAADISEKTDIDDPGKAECDLTEFVGTGPGDTIGLVIANIDSGVQEKLKIPAKFRAVGVVGSRSGSAPQIFAADEAVKASNSEIIRIEIARDGKGGAGHGCLLLFGAEDVSDVRRAVEVCLEQLRMMYGEVYKNSAGHVQIQYTARAGQALCSIFGAEEGKSFGLTIGAPAAVGVLMADSAAKAAPLEFVKTGSPGDSGMSFSNEVMFSFTGDSGAVKQAVMSGRETGQKLLKALAPGENLLSETEPYIL